MGLTQGASGISTHKKLDALCAAGRYPDVIVLMEETACGNTLNQSLTSGGLAWCNSMMFCRMFFSAQECWRDRRETTSFDELLNEEDRVGLVRNLVLTWQQYSEAFLALVTGQWEILASSGIFGTGPYGTPYTWWFYVALLVLVMHLVVYYVANSQGQRWARTLIPMMFVLSAIIPWSISVQLLTVWMAAWTAPIAITIGVTDFVINWAGVTWISGYLLYPVFALCCTWDWFLVKLGFPKPEAPHHIPDNVLRVATIFFVWQTFAHSFYISFLLVAYIAVRYIYVMARGPLRVDDTYVTDNDGKRTLVSHSYVYRGITGWTTLDHWINPAFGLGLGAPPKAAEMKAEARKDMEAEFEKKLAILTDQTNRKLEHLTEKLEGKTEREIHNAQNQAKHDVQQAENRADREINNAKQQAARELGQSVAKIRNTVQTAERQAVNAAKDARLAVARGVLDGGASNFDMTDEQVDIARGAVKAASNIHYPGSSDECEKVRDVPKAEASTGTLRLCYNDVQYVENYIAFRKNQFPMHDAPFFEYQGPCAIVYLWKNDGTFAGTGFLVENHIQTIDHNVVTEILGGRPIYATQAFNPTGMRQLTMARSVNKIYQFRVPAGFNLDYQLTMCCPTDSTGLVLIMGIPDTNPLGKSGGIVCAIGTYWDTADPHKSTGSYSSDSGMSGSPICPAVGTGAQRAFGRRVMGIHENGGNPNEFYRYQKSDINALRGLATTETMVLPPSEPQAEMPSGGKGKTKLGRGQIRNVARKIAKATNKGATGGMRKSHFWSRSLGEWVDYGEAEKEFQDSWGIEYPDEESKAYKDWSREKRKAYDDFIREAYDRPEDRQDEPAYPDEPEYWTERDSMEEQEREWDRRSRVKIRNAGRSEPHQPLARTDYGSGNWGDYDSEEESGKGKTKLPYVQQPESDDSEPERPRGAEARKRTPPPSPPKPARKNAKRKEKREAKRVTFSNPEHSQMTQPEKVDIDVKHARMVLLENQVRAMSAQVAALSTQNTQAARECDLWPRPEAASASSIPPLKPRQTDSSRVEKERINAVANVVFRDVGAQSAPRADAWTATGMPPSVWNNLSAEFKQSFRNLSMEEKRQHIRKMRTHLEQTAPVVGLSQIGGPSTATPPQVTVLPADP
jgi:hypothetical protein